MDFSEPIDLKLIREAVSNVCRDFPDEYWEKQDREGQYPQEFYDAMAEQAGSVSRSLKPMAAPARACRKPLWCWSRWQHQALR